VNILSDKKKTEKKVAFPVTNIKMPKISKQSISRFIHKYLRVLKLARRPTKDEFFKISVVAAAGIAVIGVLGFITYMIYHYLLP
jgi:protein transport protein SEC61 subunit gamma-like protein